MLAAESINTTHIQYNYNYNWNTIQFITEAKQEMAKSERKESNGLRTSTTCRA